MNSVERNPRTSEVPISAEPDRCTTDGAYLIVRYRVERERRSILYVPKPGSRKLTTRESAVNLKHTTRPLPLSSSFTEGVSQILW